MPRCVLCAAAGVWAAAVRVSHTSGTWHGIGQGAFAAGVSPEVVHYSGDGVMLTRLVNGGRTLKAADMHDEAMVRQVRDVVRRFHDDVAYVESQLPRSSACVVGSLLGASTGLTADCM